ncbi:hypothetical protein MVEN_00333700 [Mycena venus]|uniref:Uncharacterized protein n=1 Tax=Mycena venus TaxID=2733690 RepID=A0A8H6YR07_9AGAR|nr:hypothetical protein MVEN_00333700 [Mycena venus]
MKVLSPVGLVFFWRLASAAEMNHTLDDINPLVVYHAPVLDRNLTGFFTSELKDGTVTHIAATAQDSATISMNFTGTAVYVFVAYPSGFRGNESTTPNGFLAKIDGVPSGGWARGNSTDFLTGFLAYQNTTLSNDRHHFVMEIQPEWEVYFDFVKYTSLVPDSTSISSSAVAQSTSNLPASALQTKQKKVPVGAIAGGIIGGLLFLALVVTPFILRRRALAKKRAITKQPPMAIPFMVGPDDGRSQAADKSEAPPTPVLLQSPTPGRRFRALRSSLSLGIPTSASPPRNADQLSPLSATSDPGLLLVAEEVRRLTASVQRLETGVPEARDGGPIFQHPPAYRTGESDT